MDGFQVVSDDSSEGEGGACPPPDEGAAVPSAAPPAQLPTFVVHGLPQAWAAVSAAADARQPARLFFPFSFASALGPVVAREVVACARAEFPGAPVDWVIDCDGEAGLAYAALRAGAPAVRFDPSGPALPRLREIARQLGSRVDTSLPTEPVLDLAGTGNPREAARKWSQKRG